MNPHYRKAMRLRSRHARRGHTSWCNCPEAWQRTLLVFRRWQQSGRPLPTRTLRSMDRGGLLPPGVMLAVNRTGKPERVIGPTEQEG